MVADLIRDSPFGHIVRLVTRNKVFQYPEERDPELWKKYVHKEKSAHMAHHGNTKKPDEDVPELRNLRGIRSRENENASSRSSTTAVPDGHNEASGMKVDPEKGKDKNVIDWFGDDDAQVCNRLSCIIPLKTPAYILQNPKNWSRGKRFFVTFEIVFLTFSVYIGSAIYTPGLMDVTKVFGVAQVPATLGLTLYVAGYGLGPLIWSPLSEIPQIGRLWVYIVTLCKRSCFWNRTVANFSQSYL